MAWMELSENPPQVSDEVSEAISNLKENYMNLTPDEITDEDLDLVHSWIDDSLNSFERSGFKSPKRNIEDYNVRFREIIGLIS